MTDNMESKNTEQSVIEKFVAPVMKQSFIDYSMSVITERALPDVRDGLKPVHRRILHAMHDAGNTHNKAYRKSARTVGDVIGKYHPHGDASVYQAAVRMAQPFSMSQVLIDGQGNFGSIDGDFAAAMRYTEMRLTRIAGEFFTDIKKETIPWVSNYDGTEKEPSVLTAPYPNLLVNGVEGIAVGMASSIPPHNLREVCNTTLALIDNPDMETAQIIEHLKGPDFPTAAMVHGMDGFAQAIDTGGGRVRIRARWHEEDRGRGAKAIVVTEIPYQVNKSNLVAHIAQLVRDKSVEGITDLRDESNKDGIRIWIALRSGESSEAIFAELASKTDLEKNFSYNCVVLDGGRPREMGLKDIILRWIDFRKDVVLARYIYEHKQAIAKLHILEGFMKALGLLDETIALIRASKNANEAKTGLCELLGIDEPQAQAILDLRLQKLTGMELDGIKDEHKQVSEHVVHLQSIIDSSQRIEQIIKDELIQISDRYGHDRLTEVSAHLSDITHEDLIPREDVLVAMTRNGYVKRMPTNAFRSQSRGTRGRSAIAIDEGDSLSFLRQTHSHDMLMAFAKSGQAYAIKAYRIPEGSLTTKGRHIRNVIDGLDEEVQAIITLPESDAGLSVLTVTKNGQIKRSALADYDNAIRKGGVRGVGLNDGDDLVDAFTVRDEDHIILVSNTGTAIRFLASDVRVMGRTAAGVRGIRLGSNEYVVGACVAPNGDNDSLDLLCVGEKGVGKRTALSEFSPQGRGGGGVIAFKASSRTGDLVAAMGVSEKQDLIMFSSNGVSNRVAISNISRLGRATSGVILMNIDKGETLVRVTTAMPESAEGLGLADDDH